MAGQDLDEASVIDYDHRDDGPEPYFAIIFSTRRLLEQTHLTQSVEMDDTYKLIHEGYTVTVMGQSDADRKFHTRAIGVSTNSTAEVGHFYLSAWKHRVPEFKPRAYLGDAAEAYANAAFAVFPECEDRLMCFVHMYKVIKYAAYQITHTPCLSIYLTLFITLIHSLTISPCHALPHLSIPLIRFPSVSSMHIMKLFSEGGEGSQMYPRSIDPRTVYGRSHSYILVYVTSTCFVGDCTIFGEVGSP